MSGRFPSRQPTEARRNAATCLALIGLLGMAAGLVALAAMVLPQFFQAFVFVILAFGGFFLFHYLTWGWLLTRVRPGDEELLAPYRPLPRRDTEGNPDELEVD